MVSSPIRAPGRPRTVSARPLAPYVGGKRAIAARLAAMIAGVPHRLYAEPFVGMGGVFLRREAPARVEVINDISADIANLFRIAQRHPEALQAEMRFRLHPRADWDRMARQDPATLTDIERAARFVCLQKSAFGGKAATRHFAMAKVAGYSKPYDAAEFRARLEALHARLARVTIEQLPFAEFISRYDAPGVLFYLDPPYWGSEDYYGAAVFGREDFTRLRDALAGARAKWILSINDAPEIRDLFADVGNMESVGLAYGLAASGSTAARELIISRL